MIEFDMRAGAGLKFSVTLPRLSETPDVTEIDGLIAVAVAAEELGFDAISASDHPFPKVVAGEAGHQSLDPFVLLSVLSSATSRIGLHFSLIIAPYRNPFLVARMLATLDLMTHGRVIAGLGAGYLRAEFDALGADFAGRAGSVSATVAAMRAAWTGEPVVASGAGWRADGNVMSPVPPRSPVLWRGGNTRRAMTEAVAEFDGWSPFEVGDPGSKQTGTVTMSLEALPGRTATLRQLLAEAGRTRPLDVSYVRTSRRWLATDSGVVSDLQALVSAGATWIEFTINGRSADERVDGLRRFREAAASA